MSVFDESVARLHESRVVPDAIRFTKDAALALMRRLERFAKDERLDGFVVYHGMKATGHLEGWVNVLATDGPPTEDTGEPCEPLNQSHTCPPFTDC